VDNTIGWYCVKTEVRQDALAAQSLAAAGFRVFAPRALVAQNDGFGNLRLVKQPLFPGYIFSWMDWVEGWYSVRKARGVLRLISFEAAVPAQVQDEVIEEILARIGPDGLVRVGKPEYFERLLKRNDPIRLNAGPLLGLTGVFEAYRGEERVVILLNQLMGRQIRYECGRHEVERLTVQ
jgi:transcription antitermination factor NusG